MKVYRDIEQLESLSQTVITIGSFDGVHSGHQRILSQLRDVARKTGGETLVVTFHPHPRSIVYPKDKTLRLLSTLEEKIRLFESYGIDNLVILPFTVEFSQIQPLEYVDLIVRKFRPSHIVIGYDHRFGLNRAGDINLLKQKASDYSYEVIEIEKQEIEAITISSTKIREALQQGALETANALLDRPYGLTGTVVKGRQLGTELGFPTANIAVENRYKLIPQNGIYVCRIEIASKRYDGMLYIGVVPTLNDKEVQTIEVNIFDFDEDIYDQKISVYFLKYLRGDEKFDSLDALKAQLALDKENTLAYFDKVRSNEKDLDTTIAILNYNGRDLLETFMPSVSYSSEGLFSSTVIDNNSSDDSVEFMQEWFPEVDIVALDKNYGFAGGYNKGLEQVQSKYIAFLNSDVQVQNGWLTPLVEYLEKHPDIGAVMPKILSYEEKHKFEYAGAAGGYMDALAYPYCRGRLFDVVEEDKGQYDKAVSELDWVSGAAFIMRTELFNALGGFDEDFFAHMEEIDLCWRIRNAGYKLAVLPSSVVYHLGGGTLSYNNPKKTFLNFRNSLYTLFKNDSLVNLLWKIPSRLVLDGVAGVKFLLSFDIKNFLSIIKAHFSFYAHVGSLIRKRKEVKQKVSACAIGPKPNYDRPSNSIVFSYYIFGKKKFSDLKG